MVIWIWNIALALVGIFAGVYLGQEVMGGGALGWMATGAIVAACCYPLFKALFRYRVEKARRDMR